MTEIVVTGNNVHGMPVWGWEIPVYLFLGGLTAGIMVLTAVIKPQSKWMRWMPLLAPVALSIGMTALLLDLESKLHVFRFYTAFRITSPMSWGSWILLLIYPATLLLGLARLDEREVPALLRGFHGWARRSAARIERANLLLGIVLGAYTGILLATLDGRPLWGSAILGPLFLVSGLSTGAALIMLFPIDGAEHGAVRRFDLMAIAAEIVLLALFFIDQRNGPAASLFLGGAYTASFWTLVVIAGLLVPLTFELLETKVRATAMTSLLLLGGGLALRWIFVAAGQAI